MNLNFRVFVRFLFCWTATIAIFCGTGFADKESERQEKLRGSITPEREWWDVKHYRLAVEFMPITETIKGSNTIKFKTTKSGKRMQIDLQPPLKITKAVHKDVELEFKRDGNVYWLDFAEDIPANAETAVTLHYEGEPHKAKRPPWDGGVSWDTDEFLKPFIVTTCQGIGASIWWPNKDHGADEPDDGMDILVTVPKELTAVSNGRLKNVGGPKDGKRTFHWVVTQPINNYCVNVNIGNYVSFKDKFQSEGGMLDIEYWVLEHQREKAIQHFKEVPRTLIAFEHWFGKYPFPEDSYKLVSVPYPGMEHQSSVTYGNNFANGYRGRDLSNTGVGLKFDFIIVHETGHEWFGNSISMRDAADMWIHEGFTNYSENLFVEMFFTEKEAQDYVIGCRDLVLNDKPIIGEYGMNREGSGDMYYKAGNMLHTMRHILRDDEKWRAILRDMNKEFWHQTVTTKQVEDYINEKSGIDFSKFFDQYLRDTRIPILKYKVDGKNLTYWFDDVVDGFSYFARLKINGQSLIVKPSTKPQTTQHFSPITEVLLDRNFYYVLQHQR